MASETTKLLRKPLLIRLWDRMHLKLHDKFQTEDGAIYTLRADGSFFRLNKDRRPPKERKRARRELRAAQAEARAANVMTKLSSAGIG